MTLHIVSKLLDAETTDLLSSVLTPSDDVFFLQNGVYGCSRGHIILQNLTEGQAKPEIYVNLADLKARGMTGKADPLVLKAGLETLVSLSEKHTSSITW